MPTLRYAWPRSTAQWYSSTGCRTPDGRPACTECHIPKGIVGLCGAKRNAGRERALAVRWQAPGAVDRNRAAAAGLRALGIGQLAAWVETDSEIQRVAARCDARARGEGSCHPTEVELRGRPCSPSLMAHYLCDESTNLAVRAAGAFFRSQVTHARFVKRRIERDSSTSD